MLSKEEVMNIREALMLVREKYLEEQKGIKTGSTADQYRLACEEYPAMMTTAHHLWAIELAEKMP
jgi:hypothetical protein